MKHTTKTIHLRGLVYGPIWQPGFECWKPIGAQNWWRQPRRCTSALEIARQVTSDGDFQRARLSADAQFVFERETTITNDDQRIVTRLTRTRYMPVTAFPSIADMVGDKESWELEPDEEAA